MTKDLYEARLKVYQDQLLVAQQVAQRAQQQMIEAQQQVLQLQGAMADITYWLGELAKTDAVPPANTATIEP